MLTPQSRGALSEIVLEAMRTGETDHLTHAPQPDNEEDAQLALWALYEQHYRGFDDVAGEMEWNPRLISVRQDLETSFEQVLRARVPELPSPEDFAEKFFAFVSDHDGPSVATYVQRTATEDQVRELLRHRSIYHLKESDHTTWVIPRLSDRVKAAVMELQFDEYGDGDPTVSTRTYSLSVYATADWTQPMGPILTRLRWRFWRRTTRCPSSVSTAGCAGPH